jgi:predicted MFS family arabinose efflux permease
MKKNTSVIPFTGYQKLVIAILALTQFSVVLDFMVMSPLGDMIMKAMTLTPKQFGVAVSAYAFSAGISGLLTAGFADKFDRKKLLLFFYTGFIVGTVFCGLANNYYLLIGARIFTGLFGGVIGSISLAIVADVFDIHHRGRVMGFVQMGFGASQVLGVPVSIKLAEYMGWQAPFIMVAVLATLILALGALKLQPVDKHLAIKNDKNALLHLWHTVENRQYRIGFFTMSLLAVGGFMMMPFGSAFAINNLKINNNDLFMLFMVSGVASLIIMPLIGRFSDKIDKFKLFAIASLWMTAMVVIYTNLSATPLWEVMLLNVLMMMGIMSRFVPAGALTSGLPEMKDRGAYMSISSSLQQIAGGIAAVVSGQIVRQANPKASLENYNIVGYVAAGIAIICVLMMYRVSTIVKQKLAEKQL